MFRGILAILLAFSWIGGLRGLPPGPISSDRIEDRKNDVEVFDAYPLPDDWTPHPLIEPPTPPQFPPNSTSEDDEIEIPKETRTMEDGEIFESITTTGAPSSSFLAQIVLATHEITETKEELETRLAKLVCDGAQAARAAHYKINKRPLSFADRPLGDVEVKIEKMITDGLETSLYFYTRIDNTLISAEIVIDDMAQLSGQHISAVLRYPLEKLKTEKLLEEESANKWWLIVCLAGTGLALLLIGWILLVVYYNICGRPIYVMEAKNEVQIDPGSTNLPQNFEDSPGNQERPSENQKSVAFAPGLLSNFHENRPKSMRKPRSDGKGEKIDSNLRSPEIDRNLGENEGEQHIWNGGEMGEKDKEVEGNEEKEGKEEKEDNDDQGLPSPRPEDQEGDEVMSNQKGTRRPKAAGKTRPLRDREGNIIRRGDGKDVVWDHYTAAQRVYDLYGISSKLSDSSSYPHPNPPTNDGVLELKVTSLNHLNDSLVHQFL